MFGQLAALLGTTGAKAAMCGAVAAASVTGAHAGGAVDVPGLPDTETQEVAFEAGPTQVDLSFKVNSPEGQAAAEKEAEEAAAAEQEAKEEAERKAAEEAEAAAKEAEEAAAAEAEAKAQAEAEAKAAAEAEAAAKAAAEAAADDKDDDDKHDDDKDHAEDPAERIAYLESKIVYYEGELASEIARITSDFDGYIADIQADIDAATTPEEIAELESYLEYKYDLRDQMIAEKQAYYANKIAWVESEIAKLS